MPQVCCKRNERHLEGRVCAPLLILRSLRLRDGPSLSVDRQLRRQEINETVPAFLHLHYNLLLADNLSHDLDLLAKVQLKRSRALVYSRDLDESVENKILGT